MILFDNGFFDECFNTQSPANKKLDDFVSVLFMTEYFLLDKKEALKNIDMTDDINTLFEHLKNVNQIANNNFTVNAYRDIMDQIISFAKEYDDSIISPQRMLYIDRQSPISGLLEDPKDSAHRYFLKNHIFSFDNHKEAHEVKNLHKVMYVDSPPYSVRLQKQQSTKSYLEKITKDLTHNINLDPDNPIHHQVKEFIDNKLSLVDKSSAIEKLQNNVIERLNNYNHLISNSDKAFLKLETNIPNAPITKFDQARSEAIKIAHNSSDNSRSFWNLANLFRSFKKRDPK